MIPPTTDIIGVDPSTGEVVLTIADHLDWSTSTSIASFLQKKLNTYIAFVESGEIDQRFPDALGRTPVIDVVFRYAPPLATEFLPIVAAIGAHLRPRVYPDRAM